MTIIEKKSERKKKAIKLLVDNGEYSIAYALMLAEELNDNGKLLDADYEELAEYLEGLLEPVEEPTIDEDTIIEEPVGDEMSPTEESEEE